jgi:hypothetical protein
MTFITHTSSISSSRIGKSLYLNGICLTSSIYIKKYVRRVQKKENSEIDEQDEDNVIKKKIITKLWCLSICERLSRVLLYYLNYDIHNGLAEVGLGWNGLDCRMDC